MPIMKRTFHIFTFFSTALIILLVGAIFALPLYIPKLLANSISKSMGVPVDIKSVDIRRSDLTFHNLLVGNPPGSFLPYALKIKTLTIRAPLREYLEPTVNIKQIELNDIDLSVEFYTPDRKKNNWDLILDTVNKPVKNPSSDAQGSKRGIYINELFLEQIAVSLKLYNQPPRNIPPIKQIVIRDIDPENGLLTQRLTRILTNHIIKSVSGMAGITGITGVIISAPATAVQTIFAPFKFLFGGSKKNQSQTPPNQ